MVVAKKRRKPKHRAGDDSPQSQQKQAAADSSPQQAVTLKEAADYTPPSRCQLLHLLSWCSLQLDTLMRPMYENHPCLETREKFGRVMADIQHILTHES